MFFASLFLYGAVLNILPRLSFLMRAPAFCAVQNIVFSFISNFPLMLFLITQLLLF
jgi:hypothetical protein